MARRTLHTEKSICLGCKELASGEDYCDLCSELMQVYTDCQVRSLVCLDGTTHRGLVPTDLVGDYQVYLSWNDRNFQWNGTQYVYTEMHTHPVLIVTPALLDQVETTIIRRKSKEKHAKLLELEAQVKELKAELRLD